MKKTDIALIVLLFAISAAAGVCAAVTATGGDRIRIERDGALFGVYPLGEDSEIRVGDGFVVKISGGQAFVASSDCPGGDCMHMRAVDASGGSIVCLPKRIVISSEGAPAEGRPDTVAG